MPFHPLPCSVCLGGWFQELSKCEKMMLTPFVSIGITIVFISELLILPFRWCAHEIKHHYSDRDESEWVC